jgi:hypothetical protein
MKGTATLINISCLGAMAALAVCLSVEHRASLRLGEENSALRRQLSQMDEAVVENQRLSDLVARMNASPSRANKLVDTSSVADERVKELVRLRDELEALRQQGKEMEVLRADTRQVRAQESALSKAHRAQEVTDHNATAGNAAQLEIVRAEYWTDRTNMDVATELTERIRGGRLRAIASNNIKGDPDFGQVKRLTVVYRFGGTTVTNEFREGDYVVLPPE